jgi:hypothetical protein
LKVLRLTATTPDGPLVLDLPAADQPGIEELSGPSTAKGLRSDRSPDDLVE